MSSLVLQAKNLTKRFHEGRIDLTVLHGVELDVHAGETLAIVGASGSGKTTLLGLLAGLDRPTTGSVSVAGQRLDTLDEEARARVRRRLVGFVFQSFHLLPALSAEENVMLPLELEGRSDARERAASALDAVGLAKRLHHYPRQLSGGEQQRVALARAFVHGPELLFADEPTGNLDAVNAAMVADLLFGLVSEEGAAMVLVTHDAGLAARADRQVRLGGGVAQPA